MHIYVPFLVYIRVTHNWWHIALCYLEGNSSIQKVLEVYDQHIWKELDRDDAAPVEVIVM